ncbi:MAG: hypothetical protein WCS01_07905 [bacterium]
MMERWKEGFRALFTSTFGLTGNERKAVLLILTLALLGLSAKAWHRNRLTKTDPVPQEQPAD